MFVETITYRHWQVWPASDYYSEDLGVIWTTHSSGHDLVLAVTPDMLDYFQGLEQLTRMVIVGSLYRSIGTKTLWRADRVETEHGDIYGADLPPGYKSAVKRAHELLAED